MLLFVTHITTILLNMASADKFDRAALEVPYPSCDIWATE